MPDGGETIPVNAFAGLGEDELSKVFLAVVPEGGMMTFLIPRGDKEEEVLLKVITAIERVAVRKEVKK
jgi:hypothetical protein